MSPDLSWTDLPADAESLALIVRDRNAAGFVHWVVTGIDPSVQGIGEGGVPEGAVEGQNGAGTTKRIGRLSAGCAKPSISAWSCSRSAASRMDGGA